MPVGSWETLAIGNKHLFTVKVAKHCTRLVSIKAGKSPCLEILKMQPGQDHGQTDL